MVTERQVPDIGTMSQQVKLRRRAFPLRYWMLIAYTVGVPTFLRFDASGRTHEYGLFNAYAISQIALTLACLFGFVFLSLVSRQRIVIRRVYVNLGLWMALLSLFVVASLLEPQFRLAPTKSTDLFLSLYRLLEWALAFVLLLSLYSRFPAEESFELTSDLIARVCWSWIAIVWLALPIAPSFVFGSAGDTTETGARLGGALIHPAALGVISSIACLHAIVLLKGSRRVIAVAVSLMTLFLTYARAQEGIMVLSLLIFAIFFTKGLSRFIGLLGSGLLVVGGLAFAPTLLQYAMRGNGVRNLVTLSDRTLVWAAALEAIQVRPWTGYGFIAGVKGAIRDHWTYAHWIPPHAHNDILQAVLSGGVLAGVLLITLYFRIFRSAIQLLRVDRRAIFFLFVLLQFANHAFLSPLLAGGFGVLSGLLLFCSVYVLDAAHRLPARQPARMHQPVTFRPSLGLADVTRRAG